jgi:hypothetical protein
MAAGGASSVRMTKKIEWVGSTEQGAIWSFLQKKLTWMIALTKWYLMGSHSSGVEGCEI